MFKNKYDRKNKIIKHQDDTDYCLKKFKKKKYNPRSIFSNGFHTEKNSILTNPLLVKYCLKNGAPFNLYDFQLLIKLEQYDTLHTISDIFNEQPSLIQSDFIQPSLFPVHRLNFKFRSEFNKNHYKTLHDNSIIEASLIRYIKGLKMIQFLETHFGACFEKTLYIPHIQKNIGLYTKSTQVLDYFWEKDEKWVNYMYYKLYMYNKKDNVNKCLQNKTIYDITLKYNQSKKKIKWLKDKDGKKFKDRIIKE